MRFMKLILVAATVLSAQFAHAGSQPLVGEAENFAGGSIITDSDASGFKAVTRSTGGVYVWWQQDTALLAAGSYSAYARIALADGVTTPQTFYSTVVYANSQTLANQVTTISNKKFAWIRLGQFVLPQTGDTLRVSDYSTPGMKLDKVAIVKDSAVEAELVSGGIVTNDAAASGGQAVNRVSAGIYSWWVPATSDFSAGDYQVYARVRSIDGAAHNFGSYVALDGTTGAPVNKLVQSTSYAWLPLNEFTYTGGSQQIRISDWSDPGLLVDQFVIARRTPNDQHSGAQALFAGGSAQLDAREEVFFTGTPNHGLHDVNGNVMTDYTGKILGHGRISITPGSTNNEYYAFFRQQNLYNPGVGYTYQIFQGKSTDNGRNFAIDTEPVIKIAGNLTDAYDPQVVKRPEGYYMVFEGVTAGCGFSSLAASKLNGASTWTVRNTAVCTNFSYSNLAGGFNGSASTPSYYYNVESGEQYLQWVSVNAWDKITNHYQAPLGTAPDALFTTNLSFSDNTAMGAYKIPQGTASWEAQNFGVANMYYEDEYYYMVYGGADAFNCEARAPNGQLNHWSLGIARTKTPGDKASWVRSTKNEIELWKYEGSCWLEEPQLISMNGTGGGLYMYYHDAAEFENATGGGLNHNRTVARKKIKF